MNNKFNDPAFPHLHDSCQRVNDTEHWPGLTRLEWFAGMALQMFGVEQEQLDRLGKGDLPDHKFVATFCFDIAAAMVAESERRSK